MSVRVIRQPNGKISAAMPTAETLTLYVNGQVWGTVPAGLPSIRWNFLPRWFPFNREWLDTSPAAVRRMTNIILERGLILASFDAKSAIDSQFANAA